MTKFIDFQAAQQDRKWKSSLGIGDDFVCHVREVDLILAFHVLTNVYGYMSSLEDLSVGMARFGEKPFATTSQKTMGALLSDENRALVVQCHKDDAKLNPSMMGVFEFMITTQPIDAKGCACEGSRYDGSGPYIVYREEMPLVAPHLFGELRAGLSRMQAHRPMVERIADQLVAYPQSGGAGMRFKTLDPA